jgi:hypothetical protein
MGDLTSLKTARHSLKTLEIIIFQKLAPEIQKTTKGFLR